MIIAKEGVTYAVLVKADEVPAGLNFYTADEAYLQVGSWKYDAGKQLKAHAHKIYPRTTDLTHEFIFIKKGALKLFLYANDDSLLDTFTLNAGDFALLCAGGHGYEIIADGTEVVEVKNGPFPGLENDKRGIA